MDLTMFKEYDIRTRRENLDEESMVRLIDAIAIYYREDLKVTSVVLGRDSRLSSPILMEEIMKSLVESGIDVYMNPLQISTCQFYYMCMQRPSSGGIMMTASHNPKEYIGCKLVGKDVSAIARSIGPNGGIDRIKEYFRIGRTIEPPKEKGRIHAIDSIDDYINYSMKLSGVKEGDLKGLKVFAEFFSGTAGMEFAMAFEKAGATLEMQDLIPDGNFPSGNPNPADPSSMAKAREIMRNGDYDLGFAFDGDGDRMDLMFPDGEQMIPGMNLSILLPYIKEIFKTSAKEGCPYRIFMDMKTSPVVLKMIAESGFEPHIIRNGHSFIKGKLKEYRMDGYMASVEESSHYYMNFPYDPEDSEKGYAATENTLFYALLTARAYMEHREKYQKARMEQEKICRYREWSLEFDEKERIPELLERIRKAMVYRGASVIERMDDGTDLDATLFRFNLPSTFDSNAVLPSAWCQVSQRISRSEDARTRWEVAASDWTIAEEVFNMIHDLTDECVLKGWAHL